MVWYIFELNERNSHAIQKTINDIKIPYIFKGLKNHHFQQHVTQPSTANPQYRASVSKFIIHQLMHKWLS